MIVFEEIDKRRQTIKGWYRAATEASPRRCRPCQSTSGNPARDYAGFPTLLFVTTSDVAEARFAYQAYLTQHRHGATPLPMFLTTTGCIKTHADGVLGPVWRTPRPDPWAHQPARVCWLPRRPARALGPSLTGRNELQSARTAERAAVARSAVAPERGQQRGATRGYPRMCGRPARVLAAAGSEPRVVITDKLASYPPALRRVLPKTEHRLHKGLNNRAENSHQPTRQRERAMRRFKSPEQAQRFLEPFGTVGDHFRTGRYRTPAGVRRQLLAERRRTWREVVGLSTAA